MKRPWIAHQPTAATIGILLLLSGFVVLYDAYDGRGTHKPWWLGPFAPW